MKILHLDPDDMDNPLSGGGPVRTFEICRRLARRHEVTVLTPTFPGSTPELTREGVRYVRLGRKIGDHGSSHHITFFFALPRAIRKYDYDLLVEDFMPPTSATLNPLFRRRRPLVASVQWFFARTLAEQYKLPFHWGERWLTRLYRHFVVLTSAMDATIKKYNPRAVTAIIPNGIPEELFDVPLEVGETILYLGRVDFGQKGVDLLLEALARVPSEERRQLVVAGHGYEFDRLDARARELGVAPWLKVVGKVDAAQRAELFRKARFTCVPSRDETFGMVITESCAAGKPVVLWDRPPMNEVAAPGACELASPFEVQSFAAGLLRLSRAAPSELLERGRRCREWATRFRWDALAEAQEAFYLRAAEEYRR